MLVTSVLLYAVAFAVLFRPYLPSRYTYPLLPFSCVAIAVAWRPTFESLGHRRGPLWPGADPARACHQPRRRLPRRAVVPLAAAVQRPAALFSTTLAAGRGGCDRGRGGGRRPGLAARRPAPWSSQWRPYLREPCSWPSGDRRRGGSRPCAESRFPGSARHGTLPWTPSSRAIRRRSVRQRLGAAGRDLAQAVSGLRPQYLNSRPRVPDDSYLIVVNCSHGPGVMAPTPWSCSPDSGHSRAAQAAEYRYEDRPAAMRSTDGRAALQLPSRPQLGVAMTLTPHYHGLIDESRLCRRHERAAAALRRDRDAGA